METKMPMRRRRAIVNLTTILMILGDCKHNPLSCRHITQTNIVFRRSTFVSKQIGGGRAGSSALLVETIDD